MALNDRIERLFLLIFFHLLFCMHHRRAREDIYYFKCNEISMDVRDIFLERKDARMHDYCKIFVILFLYR